MECFYFCDVKGKGSFVISLSRLIWVYTRPGQVLFGGYFGDGSIRLVAPRRLSRGMTKICAPALLPPRPDQPSKIYLWRRVLHAEQGEIFPDERSVPDVPIPVERVDPSLIPTPRFVT